MPDALDLLRRVSDTYRALRSLIVEASLITESGDENNSSRGERRVLFHYAAPDRIRFEPRGRDGALHVSDGREYHTLFRLPHGDDRYHRIPAAQLHRLPHLFRSEFPTGGGEEPFLYQGVQENVVSAELLREEEGRYVVSAQYAPPEHPQFAVLGAALTFWIDARSFLILGQQGDLGHRRPTQDEVHWTRQTIRVQSIRADDSLLEDLFDFTPPPGVAADGSGRCGVSVGGGSGSMSRRPGPSGDVVEHWSSHEWQGETLVDRSRWKLRGTSLQFERRLTFSPDGKELRVVERLTGPKGDVETQSALPLG